MSTEVYEIRQLHYPILDISPTGVSLIKSKHKFDIGDRFYYRNGEVDDDTFIDAQGYRYSIVATRIYDLTTFNRFWFRLGHFFIGNQWKMAVRCEMDCLLHEQLSFDEFCSYVSEILLENKSWWYDLTEDDIRTIFDDCKTIREAMKAVEIVGEGYKPQPNRRSTIFQDLTILQRLD